MALNLMAGLLVFVILAACVAAPIVFRKKHADVEPRWDPSQHYGDED